MTTSYLTRLRSARLTWINADANNPEAVKSAYIAYMQAKQNYINSRGVK